MDKINVMISSTVDNLLGERQCLANIFTQIDFVNLVGATPYSKTSAPRSSAYNTTKIAKECDLYVLLLGSTFGFELQGGRSATEVEFDAAYHADPTKVLVFLKEDGTQPDPKQEKFIKKVCDYYSGYWRMSFKYTYELQEMVRDSFMEWLKNRASFGYGFTYLDHFIRLAVQKKPEPETEVYYSVKKDYIDLEYRAFGKTVSVQFDKKQIYKDFWGCLYSLERQITAALL